MTKYVAVYPIPDAPVMTVIPASVSSSDVEFAGAVTEALVSFGIPVVERPAILSSYIESSGSSRSANLMGVLGGDGSGASGSGIGATSSQGETRVQSGDVVELYEQTNADLVVVATGSNDWIRIVDRASRRVLFSGSVQGTTVRGKYTFRDEVGEALSALNILPSGQ